MSLRLRLDKPWQPLTPERVAKLPGQLGIYQVADARGTVVYIGQAGARAPFGLRSELQAEAAKREELKIRTAATVHAAGPGARLVPPPPVQPQPSLPGGIKAPPPVKAPTAGPAVSPVPT